MAGHETPQGNTDQSLLTEAITKYDTFVGERLKKIETKLTIIQSFYDSLNDAEKVQAQRVNTIIDGLVKADGSVLSGNEAHSHIDIIEGLTGDLEEKICKSIFNGIQQIKIKDFSGDQNRESSIKNPATTESTTTEIETQGPGGIMNRVGELVTGGAVVETDEIESVSDTTENTQEETTGGNTDLPVSPDQKYINQVRQSLEQFSMYLSSIGEGHPQKEQILGENGIQKFVDDTVAMLVKVEGDINYLVVENENGETYIKNFLIKSIGKIQLAAMQVKGGQSIDLQWIPEFDESRDQIETNAQNDLEALGSQIELWKSFESVLGEDNPLFGLTNPITANFDDPKLTKARFTIYDIVENTDVELKNIFDENIATLNNLSLGLRQELQAIRDLSSIEGSNIESSLNKLFEEHGIIEELIKMDGYKGLNEQEIRDKFIEDLFLNTQRDLQELTEKLKEAYHDGNNTLVISGLEIEFTNEREKQEVITSYIVFLNSLLHDPSGYWTVLNLGWNVMKTLGDIKTLFSPLTHYLGEFLGALASLVGVASTYSIIHRTGLRRGGRILMHRPHTEVPENYSTEKNDFEKFQNDIESSLLTGSPSIEEITQKMGLEEGSQQAQDFFGRLQALKFVIKNNSRFTKPDNYNSLSNEKKAKIDADIRTDKINFIRIFTRRSNDFYRSGTLRNMGVAFDNIPLASSTFRNLTQSIHLLHPDANDFYLMLHFHDRLNGWQRSGSRALRFTPFDFERFGVGARAQRIADYYRGEYENSILNNSKVKKLLSFMDANLIDNFLAQSDGTAATKQSMIEVIQHLEKILKFTDQQGGHFSEIGLSNQKHIKGLFEKLFRKEIKISAGVSQDGLDGLVRELSGEFDDLREIFPNAKGGDMLSGVHENIRGISNEAKKNLRALMMYGMGDENDGGNLIKDVLNKITSIRSDTVDQEIIGKGGKKTIEQISIDKISPEKRGIILTQRRTDFETFLDGKINELSINVTASERNLGVGRGTEDIRAEGGAETGIEVDTEKGRLNQWTSWIQSQLSRLTGRPRSGKELLNGNTELEEVKTHLQNNYGITNPDEYFKDILNGNYTDIVQASEAINQKLITDGYLVETDGEINWKSVTPDTPKTPPTPVELIDPNLAEPKEVPERVAPSGREIYFTRNGEGPIRNNNEGRALQAILLQTGISENEIRSIITNTPGLNGEATRAFINTYLKTKGFEDLEIQNSMNSSELDRIKVDIERIRVLDLAARVAIIGGVANDDRSAMFQEVARASSRDDLMKLEGKITTFAARFSRGDAIYNWEEIKAMKDSGIIRRTTTVIDELTVIKPEGRGLWFTRLLTRALR